MIDKRNKFSVTYFIVAYGLESSGVAKKIQDQLEVWRYSKRDFLLFVVTDYEGSAIWKDLVPESVIKIETKGKLRYISRTRHLYSAVKLTRDILYVRETFPVPYLKWLTRPKWIVEIQTIQENELRLRSAWRHILYKSLRKLWNKKFDGVIFVSSELSGLLQNSFPKSKSTVISNGINLERLKPSMMTKIDNNSEFFFMGSLDQDWQGTEQLLELAASLPEVKFHLVGETKFKSSELNNVVFHGFLESDQYSLVASNCNLAFGTLNQQITGMNEASPLKVREYLALGMPVVIRYIDTDFKGKHDFLLNLPIDKRRLVDFKDEIVKFSKEWQSKRVSRMDVEPFISSRSKESQRLAFFDRILG